MRHLRPRFPSLLLALAATAALGAEAPPERLSATGLYAAIDTKTLAPQVIPFTPQYPLWSDGAVKRRWLMLPEGSWIDASDADAWIFPVGTRLWKEFSFGRRVETRYLELTAEGWLFATYRWLEDESDALLVPRAGARAAASSAPGVAYDLPSRADCRACHEGNVSRVLGFSALQLSRERDELAPHGEALRAGDLDLTALVERGLVRNLSPELMRDPPKVPGRTAAERAVLGYLHGNCSSCHNGRGALARLEFSTEVRVAPGAGAAGLLETTVGRVAQFRPSGSDPLVRLVAGHPESSLLVQRMSRRDPVTQMPPLGSRRVDLETVALLENWVREELSNHPTDATLLAKELP